MNATNKALSIVAFYLSEYDMQAVEELGFRTRNETIKTVSEKIGNGNNYLKLRRDEFDALPDSASPRKGWRNRPPLKEVTEMAAYLHQFSFEELSEIVRTLIGQNEDQDIESDNSNVLNPEQIDEEELERIINFTDPSAQLVYEGRNGSRRVYNRRIVTQLKKLYRGSCQICGLNPVEEYDVNICEAHHIDFFAASQNNDSDNIIILCPNHHRLIHLLKPTFNPETLAFSVDNSEMLRVKLDFHLKKN